MDGATRLTRAARLVNRRSIFNEKEAVEGSAHGGRGGASTSSCVGATQVVPRTAKDIPDPSCARAQRREMSVKAHRTAGAQTTEPGHNNGEFVNDVRVSPIDEGVGVVEEDELSRAARRPRTGASVSPPRSRRATRSRRRRRGQTVACGTTTFDWSQQISSTITPNSTKSASWWSKLRSPCTSWMPRRTSFWGHLGSGSCQKKCIKKCHRANPERLTLHVSQILSAGR